LYARLWAHQSGGFLGDEEGSAVEAAEGEERDTDEIGALAEANGRARHLDLAHFGRDRLTGSEPTDT
jgi:hypothetical protein